MGTREKTIYDDLIRRQAALDAFGLSEKTRKWGGDHSGYNTRMLYEIQDELEAIEPSWPKRGKWIYTSYFTWECSECKKNPTLGMGYVQSKDELFEFCPNCGSKNIEESNDD